MMWPGYVTRIPGSCFGNVQRPNDRERKDMIVTYADSDETLMSGESKNWTGKVGQAQVNDIVQLNASSKLLVVFCRHLGVDVQVPGKSLLIFKVDQNGVFIQEPHPSDTLRGDIVLIVELNMDGY
jgi:hypothetical protein